MQDKTKTIAGYLATMIFVVILGVFAISFFVQKSIVCDENHLQLCKTKNIKQKKSPWRIHAITLLNSW